MSISRTVIVAVGAGSRKRDSFAAFYVALQQKSPQIPVAHRMITRRHPASILPNSALNWGPP